MAFEFQDDGSDWVHFLVTRIATRIGALEGNYIPFIEGDRAYIGETYLIQSHTQKKLEWLFDFLLLILYKWDSAAQCGVLFV